MLAMGLTSNTIVLIELAHADQVVKIPIPRKTTEFTIHKLFLDPSGRHLVITSQQGENWYLYKVSDCLRQDEVTYLVALGMSRAHVRIVALTGLYRAGRNQSNSSPSRWS